MKFKVLTLTFGVFIFTANVFAATCGTASSPDYIYSSSQTLDCEPAQAAVSITVLGSSTTLTPATSGNSIFYFGTVPHAVNSFSNSGTIDGASGSAFYLDGYSTANTITQFTNTSTGVIKGAYGFDIENGSTITKFDNYGLISGQVTSAFSLWGGNISELNNYKTIESVAAAISTNTASSQIGAINNYSTGVIQGGASNSGIYNTSGASINTITNLGAILGDGANNAAGIDNNGVITNLNNAQGAITTTNPTGIALTYSGNLPTNYSIIINSLSSYGKLEVLNTSSLSTIFGISALSARGSGILGSYSSIITGLTNTQLGVTGSSKTGTSNGYSYTLTERVTTPGSEVWDLTILSAPLPIPTGPSAADTQVSLQNTAAGLRSIYALQNSVVANSLNYDCQVFDKNDVCVSAGGRNTNVQAGGVNNVSALLIAAYRAMPEVRLGAYLDQNLSVTTANSPVNMSNGGPLFGLFGVWNQNPDGTETEVKVSAAFGQKNATMTRAIVGTSEAGTGSSTLNNTGVQAIAKYGFAVTKDAMVSPYIGLRYTQGNMGSYVEATSATVTTPLTYAALNTNATTFMAGVHGKYRLTPEATVQASVGLESDTNVNNGSLSATGITGLTAINFNPNPVKTRPVAMLGAYYDVEKNQRVAVTGIYRQEPFQAVGSTTALATYTVGF